MKISTLLSGLLLLLLLGNQAFSQEKKSFNYQAVIRKATGELLPKTDIAVRFSIKEKNGNLLFSELSNVTTDPYGVINLSIGNGTPLIGTIEKVDFSNDLSLNVEVDTNKDGVYDLNGVSAISNVPKAYFSSKAALALKAEGLTFDLAPVATSGDYNDLKNKPAEQTLTFDNTSNVLTISKGNNVDLSSLKDGIQNLSLSGKLLSIGGGNSVDLSGIDTDKDQQTLSIWGNTLALSNGNAVILPTGGGSGDMSKTTYDVNANNKVDVAENAEKIGGTAVSTTAPIASQVLTYNGTVWAPAATASSVTVTDNLTSTSATEALSAKQGKTLNDALTAETTRATAAEATLTTDVATNATAIAAETTRATAAEATLTTDVATNATAIAAETTRATVAEATLTTDVATNATDIAAETTRATAAEATLTTDVATNATAIAAETTRATAAEATLTADVATNATDIAAETTRATAAEATLTTDVATNATAIAAETTRATAAEATLTTDVATNATDIAAETTRATAAEATKIAKTDAFVGDVTGTYNATTVEKIQGTAVSATAPTVNGQVLTYNSTTTQWEPAAAAGVADADAITKGIVMLAGDLAGTGSTAAVPVITDAAVTNAKLAADAVTTDKITDATIATADVANAAVTYAKMQNVAASSLIGNSTGSAAAAQEITVGDGLTLTGATLNTAIPAVHFLGAADGTTYTLLPTDKVIITSSAHVNKIILPEANTCTGREVRIVNITADAAIALTKIDGITASVIGGMVNVGTEAGIIIISTGTDWRCLTGF